MQILQILYFAVSALLYLSKTSSCHCCWYSLDIRYGFYIISHHLEKLDHIFLHVCYLTVYNLESNPVEDWTVKGEACLYLTAKLPLFLILRLLDLHVYADPELTQLWHGGHLRVWRMPEASQDPNQNVPAPQPLPCLVHRQDCSHRNTIASFPEGSLWCYCVR